MAANAPITTYWTSNLLKASIIASASSSWLTGFLDYSGILESGNIRSVAIFDSLSFNVTPP
jgi:hypothetical protein